MYIHLLLFDRSSILQLHLLRKTVRCHPSITGWKWRPKFILPVFHRQIYINIKLKMQSLSHLNRCESYWYYFVTVAQTKYLPLTLTKVLLLLKHNHRLNMNPRLWYRKYSVIFCYLTSKISISNTWYNIIIYILESLLNWALVKLQCTHWSDAPDISFKMLSNGSRDLTKVLSQKHFPDPKLIEICGICWNNLHNGLASVLKSTNRCHTWLSLCIFDKRITVEWLCIAVQLVFSSSFLQVLHDKRKLHWNVWGLLIWNRFRQCWICIKSIIQ